jgi:DNA-directed RNA polymerase specialized sigma24 family protein
MLKDRTSSHTPEAFETVASQHYAAISRAAHDLVPDTYLRASRFWHRFTSGTQARAWGFMLWRHTRISDYRTRARQLVLVEGAQVEPVYTGVIVQALIIVLAAFGNFE